MSALQSPIFWLVCLAIVVFVVIAVLKKCGQPKWGFREMVKNPDCLDGVTGNAQQAEAAVQAARAWDEEKTASEGRKFIFEVASSRAAWREARILRDLGELTHQTVI